MQANAHPAGSIHQIEHFLRAQSGGLFDALHTLGEDHIQRLLSPSLRALAVRLVSDLIRTDNYPGGNEALQGELLALIEQESAWAERYGALHYKIESLDVTALSGHVDLADLYSQYMSIDGVYSTSVEAKVLADYFGMTLFFNNQRWQLSDANLPREIRLRHQNQGALAHYDIFGRSIGNGNCLFSAFGQQLADIWVREGLGHPDGRSMLQAAYVDADPDKCDSSKEQELVPGGGSKEDAGTNKQTREEHRFMQKLAFQKDALSMLNQLFNVPDLQKILDKKLGDDEPLTPKAVQMIADQMKAQVEKKTGTEVKLHSAFKNRSHTTEESLDIQNTLTETAKSLRPDLFAPESDVEAVFIKIMQEGFIADWLNMMLEAVKQKAKTEKEKAAIREYQQGLVWFLREVSAGRDPLSFDVPPEDYDRVEELISWGDKQSYKHPDWDLNQKEISTLEKRIKEKRFAAMRKGYRWVKKVIKKINPDFKQKTFRDGFKNESRKEKRKEFSALVGSAHEKYNFLELFYETVYRQGYGQQFYEFVCESNDQPHNQDYNHVAARSLWLLSQLDTIHAKPKEARSRMPGTSVDGRKAKNYGYDMESSLPFFEWSQKPVIKTTAGMLMEAFTQALEFGVTLDLDRYIDGFMVRIADDVRRKYHHDVDGFKNSYFDFESFLFRHVLHREFSSKLGSMSKQLLSIDPKPFAAMRFVREKAMEVLRAFQDFCQKIEAGKITPVLGIGFNGNLFSAPSHAEGNKNEIWLAFSENGRTLGGDTFLFFQRYFASQYHVSARASYFVQQNTERCYSVYASLIRQQIQAQKLSILGCNSERMERSAYIQKRLEEQEALFDGFIAEIDSGVPFEVLTSEFRSWLAKASNWFGVPRYDEFYKGLADVTASLNVANAMTDSEKQVQEMSREFLLDVLCGRDIRETHPNLMQWIFQHWREEIVQVLSKTYPQKASIMSNIPTLGALPKRLKDLAEKIIVILSRQVHPDIKASWSEAIDKRFQSYRSPRQGKIDKKAAKRDKGILEKTKSLAAKKAALPTLPEKKKKAVKGQINSILKQLDTLKKQKVDPPIPQKVQDLSESQYATFKKHFFSGKGATQCAEPSLSRVVGHDRFLSMMIIAKAKKPLGELGLLRLWPIVAPCPDRCQHNVTGHVYAGDMMRPQNANRLNIIRQTQGFGSLPYRLFVARPRGGVKPVKRVDSPKNK